MFVVTGVPAKLDVVREWESVEHGPQRSVSFDLTHEAVKAPTGDFRGFEARGAAVDAVVKAAKTGATVTLLADASARLSKAGKPWAKVVCYREVS